jgi:hypothetical protein
MSLIGNISFQRQDSPLLETRLVLVDPNEADPYTTSSSDDDDRVKYRIIGDEKSLGEMCLLPVEGPYLLPPNLIPLDPHFYTFYQNRQWVEVSNLVNKTQKLGSDKINGIGSALMEFAIGKSIELGCNGRLRLTAGMNEYKGAPYFYWSLGLKPIENELSAYMARQYARAQRERMPAEWNRHEYQVKMYLPEEEIARWKEHIYTSPLPHSEYVRGLIYLERECIGKNIQLVFDYL